MYMVCIKTKVVAVYDKVDLQRVTLKIMRYFIMMKN